MRDTYTPWLLSCKGKVVVMLATSCLLAWGIFGVTQVRLVLSPVRGGRVCHLDLSISRGPRDQLLKA